MLGGLEFLTSSNPLTLASQSAGITGMSQLQVLILQLFSVLLSFDFYVRVKSDLYTTNAVLEDSEGDSICNFTTEFYRCIYFLRFHGIN